MITALSQTSTKIIMLKYMQCIHVEASGFQEAPN